MRLVRSIITLIVCFVSAVCVVAEDTETNLSRVELTLTQSVERHSRRENIRNVCRSGHEVKGCTDFPKERLECNCELQRGRWVINASAKVDAVIHLSDNFTGSQVLMHEQMHLTDLEASLREHLDKITSRQYQSEKACKTYAGVLSDSPHFRVVMNQMRIASNEKLGCDRKGAF